MDPDPDLGRQAGDFFWGLEVLLVGLGRNIYITTKYELLYCTFLKILVLENWAWIRIH
jgi:hypothetical protein